MNVATGNEVFAVNLRMLIEKAGVSINKFAMSIDVEPRTVKYWLASKSCPRIDCAIEIADFFGVSVDSMFKENVGMNTYTTNIINELMRIKIDSDIRAIHDVGYDNTSTTFAATNDELKELKKHFESVFGVKKRIQFYYVRQVCEVYAQNRHRLKNQYNLV